MKDYGFLGGDRDLGNVEDILKARGNVPVITAKETQSVAEMIALFKKHGVSQVPIVNDTGDDKGRPSAMIAEIDLLRGLQNGTLTASSPAKAALQPLGGLIYPKARIEELYRIFETDQVAVVVDSEIVGVVSLIDVIDYMESAGDNPVAIDPRHHSKCDYSSFVAARPAPRSWRPMVIET